MWIASSRFERGVAAWDGFPQTGLPEMAFVGRSNVGKSSLINMLAGRKRLARISRTPGKTQEFNYYLVNDGCYLVDLPGYGYAKVARTRRQKWLGLIERYLTQRADLCTAVLLIDARHPPTESDMDMVSLLRACELPWLAVLSKADKLSATQRSRSLARVRKAFHAQGLSIPVILSSSKTGIGRTEILDWLERFAGLVQAE